MGVLGLTVLHAVGFAFDDGGIGAVEEPVEDGGGDAGVVVEDSRPVLVGLVGGDDQRAAFIAFADDLEKEIGAGLVEGKVADLIEDEHAKCKVRELANYNSFIDQNEKSMS